MRRIPWGTLAGGIASGFVNGLLGAGGGMLLLPLLSREMSRDGNTDPPAQQRAHATSLAVMLAISGVSALLYTLGGQFEWTLLWRYLPGGILGGILGAFVLSRVPPTLLRRLFGVVVLFAGLRLLLR